MHAFRLRDVKHKEFLSRILRSQEIILLNAGNRALSTLASVGFAGPTKSDAGRLSSSDIDEGAVAEFAVHDEVRSCWQRG